MAQTEFETVTPGEMLKVAFLAEYASTYFDSGVIPVKGARARGAVAWAFVAGDGKPFVVHLSSPPKFWQGLASTVGHPEWLEDERFATAKARRANHPALPFMPEQD